MPGPLRSLGSRPYSQPDEYVAALETRVAGLETTQRSNE